MLRSSVVSKPFVVLAICLLAILATCTTTEGGRDVPSASNNENEVSGGQSFATTLPATPQVRFPAYMANSPERLYENGQFIFDPHFGFPWFFGFPHMFPFHHFKGMKAAGPAAGPMDIPNYGKYEHGSEVPEAEVSTGNVAGRTP